MLYAQILLRTNRVNLIGGEEVGLPINDEKVACIDITNRDEEVFIGMKYDFQTDTFFVDDTPDIFENDSHYSRSELEELKENFFQQQAIIDAMLGVDTE